MGMGLYQRSYFLSGVVCLWIVRYWQLIHRFSLEIAPTLEHMFHLTPCSVALARSFNAFAIHQVASRPRHRASVNCNTC
jgi:hypothetical protein